MIPLGTLIGTGKVSADGEVLGSVKYRIDVYRHQRMIQARGSIEGDGELLYKMSNMSALTLSLSGGRDIDFYVMNCPPLSNTATILVGGRIPGF